MTYIFGLIFIISIPFLINELYKTGGGYITMWGAEDVLTFYGSLLAFMGTVGLGALALRQNVTANEISKRMLNVEELRSYPYVKCKAWLGEFRQPILADEIPNLRAQQICLNSSISKETMKKNYSIPLYYLSEENKQGERRCLYLEIMNVSDTIIQNIEFESITTNLMIEDGEKTKTKSFKFNHKHLAQTTVLYPNEFREVQIHIVSNYPELLNSLFIAPTKLEISIIVHTVAKEYPQKIIIDACFKTVDINQIYNIL